MKMKPTTDETITAIAVGIRHGDPAETSRGLAVPVFLRADGFGNLVRYADGTVEITVNEDDVRTLISMLDELVLSAEKDLAGVYEGSASSDYDTARPAWKRFAERRTLIKRLLKEHDEKVAAAAASVKETHAAASTDSTAPA